MIRHDVKQNTPEWDALRLGTPTASSGSKFVTGTGKIPTADSTNKYVQQLAIEKYTGEPFNTWSGNASTEYGHEMEPESAAWYSFTHNCELMEGGFYTDDLLRYGASPDNVVVGEPRGVELKNFPVSHIEALLYWHKHKKVMPGRMSQLQMQMFVCEFERVDLVFYSPTLPKLVIPVERDDKFCTLLEKQLSAGLTKRDEIINTLKSFEEAA